MTDEVNIELRAADIELGNFVPSSPASHATMAGLFGVRAHHKPTGLVGEGIANTPMKARHHALNDLKGKAQEWAERRERERTHEASLGERVKALEDRMARAEGGLDMLKPKGISDESSQAQVSRVVGEGGDAVSADDREAGDRVG